MHRIIGVITQHRNAAYFWTIYSLGLRLEEGLNLQVGDIDSGRMMVHVHRSKGAKDRYLPLPTSTLAILRDYWATHRHPKLLFPAIGRNKKTALTTSVPMDLHLTDDGEDNGRAKLDEIAQPGDLFQNKFSKKPQAKPDPGKPNQGQPAADKRNSRRRKPK